MKDIYVRKITTDDFVEGRRVYRPIHSDFVKEYEVASVSWQDSTEVLVTAHVRSIFGEETSLRVDKKHTDGKNPWITCGSFPSAQRLAEALEAHGPIVHTIPDWYVEAEFDSTESEHKRVIEPEGIIATVEVFMPFDEDDEGTWDEKRLAKETFLREVFKVFYEDAMDLEHLSSRLSSEEHTHVFDEDGILVAADVRGSTLRYMKGMTVGVVSALEVDVNTAQRVILQEMRDRAARR